LHVLKDLPETLIPTKWETFLRNYDNKTELFGFLADVYTTMAVNDGKLVLLTKKADIIDTGDVQNRNYFHHDTHIKPSHG